MKNSCKSNQMQQKAVEVIMSAMRQIMEADAHESSLRDINMDGFIQSLNGTLMCHDPAFAASKGINT